MSVDKYNISNAPYTHEQCAHGNCLNHSPKWERVGEPYCQSYPSFFLERTTFLDRWVHRHCGMPMQRVSRYIMEQCKLCGRKKEILLDELAALCTCCGYHKRVRHPAILCFIERENKRQKKN